MSMKTRLLAEKKMHLPPMRLKLVKVRTRAAMPELSTSETPGQVYGDVSRAGIEKPLVLVAKGFLGVA